MIHQIITSHSARFFCLKEFNTWLRRWLTYNTHWFNYLYVSFSAALLKKKNWLRVWQFYAKPRCENSQIKAESQSELSTHIKSEIQCAGGAQRQNNTRSFCTFTPHEVQCAFKQETPGVGKKKHTFQKKKLDLEILKRRSTDVFFKAVFTKTRKINTQAPSDVVQHLLTAVLVKGVWALPNSRLWNYDA